MRANFEELTVDDRHDGKICINVMTVVKPQFKHNYTLWLYIENLSVEI